MLGEQELRGDGRRGGGATDDVSDDVSVQDQWRRVLGTDRGGIQS